MFGVFRTYLALWVMVYHLLNIPIIGRYAVYGFYVLSGFLMTTIMHNTYKYNLSGIKKYLSNRFLRLFPMYWSVALISLLIIICLGQEWTKVYHEALYIPSSFESLMQNILMIFISIFPQETLPRLSPPTWALTVEIFFYLAIALGISKTKKRVLIWLGLSLLYIFLSYVYNLDRNYRYFPIFAASFPFSIGSLLFFQKESIKPFANKSMLCNPFIIFIILTVYPLIFIFLSQILKYKFTAEIGFYLNIIIFAFLIIPSLYYRKIPLISKQLDQKIGNYSYPIYLLHWPIGALSSYLIFKEPIRGLSSDGLISFLLTLCLVYFVSKMLILLIDRPIENFRKSVKKNN